MGLCPIQSKTPVRRPSDETYTGERSHEPSLSNDFEDAVRTAFTDRFDADPDIGA